MKEPVQMTVKFKDGTDYTVTLELDPEAVSTARKLVESTVNMVKASPFLAKIAAAKLADFLRNR